MDTVKLYYLDSYRKEADAEVLSAQTENGVCRVVLSQTVFYPEGGGQPADHGFLTLPSGKTVSVTDVHEKNGEILHTVSEEIAPGTAVKETLDWDRRFDHMQQHSGEHIASGMICSRFHCRNTGFHLGAETVTIDYDAEISFSEILDLEKEVTAYLFENHETEIFTPSPEELETLSYRSKKELTGEVRIVRFPGADICACCGTHVRRSGEIGTVKFLSAQHFRGGTRFELLCGKRASDYLARCFQETKAIGNLLHAKETETFPVVKKLSEELGMLKVRLSKTEEKYFEELSRSYRGAGSTVYFCGPMEPDSIRKLSVLLGEQCGGRACVFSGEGNFYRYAVSDPGNEVRQLIQKMNAALCGRGGGKGSFGQGSIEASEKEIRLFIQQEDPSN